MLYVYYLSIHRYSRLIAMFLSYIKMTWKVMLRNKFFTFISLFGISFTIMILIVVMAGIDLLIGDNYPENNRHRTLYINGLHLSKEGNFSQQKLIDGASYEFVSRYILPMQTPETVSMYAYGVFNKFTGNQIQRFLLKYTDAELWKIMNFTFVEGRPFTLREVDKASRVAVITEHMRDAYFGNTEVKGKYIESGEARYQVIGVVQNPAVGFAYADIWVPLTLDERIPNESTLTGHYHAILLAKKASDMGKIKAEYAARLKKVAFPDPANVDID